MIMTTMVTNDNGDNDEDGDVDVDGHQQKAAKQGWRKVPRS